jgi:THO complex subunit 2
VATSAGELFARALSLVGYFDLDPTRVLDLILDVFAFSLQKEGLFVELLRAFAFPSSTIASLLAFKLAFLADRKDPRAFDGIMAVVSVLLSQDLVAMDQVYASLSPSDADFEKELAARDKKLMTASRQAGLGAAAAPAAADPDAPVAPASLGYAEPSVVIAAHQSMLNQKAALLAAVVARGDTGRARWMIQRLPGLVRVSVPVQQAICRHLRGLLDTALTEEAKEWLGYLGTGLHLDAILFTRLCRLLATAPQADAEFYLRGQLLPAFSLCSASPALAHELWQLLQRLPYTRRFDLYHDWREAAYSSSPELMLARALAMHDTRRVMRRLAKENVKQLGRLIGKISHCSPAAVFPVILDQLQSYDNLIQPVIESLKYATALSFDILTCIEPSQLIPLY